MEQAQRVVRFGQETMGMKPRRKPSAFSLEEKPISAYDSIGLGLETWTVIRRLHTGHKTKEFAMRITQGKFQRVTRGPSKGRQRMTLVIEYIDED